MATVTTTIPFSTDMLLVDIAPGTPGTVLEDENHLVITDGDTVTVFQGTFTNLLFSLTGSFYSIERYVNGVQQWSWSATDFARDLQQYQQWVTLAHEDPANYLDTALGFLLGGIDSIVGSDGNDTLDGSDAPDSLQAMGGNDGVKGGFGADTLDGGSGADTLDGGEGDDVYIVDTLDDVVSEASGGGFDTIRTALSFSLVDTDGAGTQGDNVESLELTGSANASAQGNALNNVLVGNNGNNTLDGAGGSNTLAGGAGDDNYIVASASDRVREAAGEGTDSIVVGMSYSLVDTDGDGDRGGNVENLVLTGSAGATLVGNALNNALTANAAGNGLVGGAGADTLDGAGGVDWMLGGAGDDTYTVDSLLPAYALVVGGSADEPVSLGRNFRFTGAESITYLVYNDLSGDGLVDSLFVIFSDGVDAWTVNVTTNALGTNLAPGNYVDARQGAFTPDGHPGLTVYGGTPSGGIGASTDAGGFVIQDVLFDYSGGTPVLVRLSLSFEARTGSADGAVVAGMLNYDVAAAEPVIEFADGGIDTVRSSISYTLGAYIEHLELTGGGAISGTGNSLDNSITGNDAANLLDGGAGSDVMIGGTGNDTYVVNAATDVVTELPGQGTDTVQSTVGYSLFDTDGAGSNGGNVENLTLLGSAAINGVGNALANILQGNSGNNSLSGSGDNDTLSGDAGDDTLDGGAGSDSLTGGTGNDSYVVNAGSDLVVELVGEGTDTIQSTASYSLLDTDGAGSNGGNVEHLTLTGSGNINATGNALDNTLTGNAGNNVLNGSTGTDTVSYATATAPVTVSLALGTQQNTGGAGLDTLSNLENVTGSIYNDSLSGNSGANVLRGGLGSDTLSGAGGNDTYVLNVATDVVIELANQGSDEIQTTFSYSLVDTDGAGPNGGNVENLTLTGGGNLNATGNDLDNVLAGNAGNNVLDGGNGTDTASYAFATAAVTVTLATALQQNTVGAGLDTLTGFENLTGSNYDDTLAGNSGSNLIRGGAGNDTMSGGQGNDVYVLNVATDVVIELLNQGSDEIQTTFSYSLVDTDGAGTNGGNVENLTLTGSGNIDATGNDLANTLIGTTGGNALNGGNGDDVLRGWTGNDVLTGSAGADAFVFETALNGVTNVDTVADFVSGSDRIRLDDDIFAAFNAGISSAVAGNQFESGAGVTTSHAATTRIIYDTSTGKLYYDSDGSSGGTAAVQFATLTGHPTLAAGDFLIVA